jgi:sulfite exporter TauE/SafE
VSAKKRYEILDEIKTYAKVGAIVGLIGGVVIGRAAILSSVAGVAVAGLFMTSLSIGGAINGAVIAVGDKTLGFLFD